MMNNLFGAAYYPEYMPYNRTKEDLDLMKKAGMNVVRIAESTWSTLEPVEGEYNFEYIKQVIDYAEEIDMFVIIGTPTYAVPSWLVKKDDDILVTQINKKAKYGQRQLINIRNKTYLEHSEKIIRKLMEYTAGYKCVIGFQLDNETKHYGTYDMKTQGEFKKYLIDKFETTDKFNYAFGLAYWSNSIHSWDDLPDMRGCINGGLSCEYEKFQRKIAVEFLEWQSKIVSEYVRDDQFITHNSDFDWRKFGAKIAQDGYSYGVQGDMDHYGTSKCVTIAGTDIYHPTQSKLTGAEIAFCGDEIRCLKDDNYIVLECQAQAFKEWTPYPKQLRLHAYSHLASGACGVMYWNWNSLHSGYETYWKGVLSHDLKPNRIYNDISIFGNEFRKFDHQLTKFKKSNDIALLVDNTTFTSFKWFPLDDNLSYNDVVRWTYDALYEINLECDVVFPENIDLSKYKIVVTPALHSASECLLNKLKDFVAKGGVLISTFRSFVADEYLRVYPETQPHILNECFAMNYTQHITPDNAKINGAKVLHYGELLENNGAESLGKYEHKYWCEYDAITKNKYENGFAYYIGCFTEKEQLKEVYKDAIKEAGVKGYENIEYPIIIRSGKNNEGKNMHFILHYSQEERTLNCPFDNVKDILTGAIFKKDEKIELKDWEVLVLVEEN